MADSDGLIELGEELQARKAIRWCFWRIGGWGRRRCCRSLSGAVARLATTRNAAVRNRGERRVSDEP